MKALILAGGKGSRLRPLTNTIAKHLLPVANKPILFYILEQLKETGIHEIGIVISPETGADLKLAIGDGTKWGVKISYVLQSQPLGLAHAVKTAGDFLKNDDFVLFLGDNLIREGIKQIVEEFKTYSPDALIVLKEVADPRSFGVAEIDLQGKVTRVIEKPKEPKSNLALVGAYVFKSVVHNAIDNLKPSWRGEFEITDAIQQLLDMNCIVRSHILQGWWLDTGKKDDLLEANRIILDEYLNRSIKGDVDSLSNITGRVEISEGSQVINSVIRGPVSISNNCKIINSYIGPYSSIGSETVIENSSIEYSVILNNSHVQDIQRLADSVIGRNVEIVRRVQNFEVARLFVGDYDRVEL